MNIWIKVLQKAKNFGKSGFSKEEMFEAAELDNEEQAILTQLLNNDKSGYIVKSSADPSKYYLSYSGYMALVDIEKLKQARKASKDSQKTANKSIKLAEKSVEKAEKSIELTNESLDKAKRNLCLTWIIVALTIIIFLFNIFCPSKTILIEDRTKAQVEETIESQDSDPPGGVEGQCNYYKLNRSFSQSCLNKK